MRAESSRVSPAGQLRRHDGIAANAIIAAAQAIPPDRPIRHLCALG
jgi:hypothetical protein